jgi:hypothetical protein
MVQGRPDLQSECFHHIGRAIQNLQKQLSTLKLDDGSVATVLSLLGIELALCNYTAVHNHLKGVVKVVQHIEKRGRVNGMSHYALQKLAFYDAMIGLLGYDLAIPDDLISMRLGWVKAVCPDPEAQPWVFMDLRHVEFLRMITRFKIWAEKQRKIANAVQEPDESEIVDWGNRIMEKLEDYRQQVIPPYERMGQTGERQFLGFPQLKFVSQVHAQMHMVWCAMWLITSHVAYPIVGSKAPGRQEAAIEFGQMWAALGDGIVQLIALKF